MKWIALLVVVAGVLVGPRLLGDPPRDCPGGTTPGGLVDSRDPGAATADAAVVDFLEDADHYTSESSRHEVDVVTYRTYDADDEPLFVVEAEHRVPKGWFVGRTTTC